MIQRLDSMKHSTLIFLALIVTVLSYANIIQNSFVWDDYDFILSWQTPKHMSSVPLLFRGDLPMGHEGVYRPVRSLVYLFTYQVLTDNPIGYHLMGIVIHGVSTMLVYAIAFRVTTSKMSALFSSILFGVHPVHTEAVSYVTTSFDIIGITCALTALVLFMFKRNRIAAAGIAFIGFMTYELTLVLPVILSAYHFFIQKGRINRTHLGEVAPYWIGVGTYFVLRALTIGYASRGVLLAHSIYYSALTMLKVVWFYSTVLFIPIRLTVTPPLFGSVTNLDIPLGHIQSQSIGDIQTLLGIAVLCVAAWVIFSSKGNRVLRFCTLATILCIVPVMSSVYTGTLFAEKYLYFASVFFCIGLGTLFAKKVRQVFLIVSLMFFILTIRQNTYWKNSYTLWSQAVAVSPKSAVAHHNLGYAYYRDEEYDNALNEWNKAVSIFPEYAESYINMGEVYMLKQEYDMAIKMYTLATETNPYLGQGFYELANAYLTVGDLENAQKVVEQSVLSNPLDAWLHYNRGVIYLKQGKTSEALEAFTTARELDAKNQTPAQETLELLVH